MSSYFHSFEENKDENKNYNMCMQHPFGIQAGMIKSPSFTGLYNLKKTIVAKKQQNKKSIQVCCMR